MASISHAVGVNCLNRSNDVSLVQSLLNRQISRIGVDRLDVDGDCGPLTTGAIEGFQRRVMGWSARGADGVVIPAGPTWMRLNGNVDNPGAIRPVTVPANGRPQTSGTSANGAQAGGAASGGAAGGYQAFRQGAYSGNLGSSNLSIAGYGCAMCTLVMAATLIGSRTNHWPAGVTPQELTPPIGNQILTRAGAFQGGSLAMPSAARALGMSYDEYGRTSQLNSRSITLIDGHLQKNLPVAAHVDYKRGSAGDHWVLITSRNGNATYNALDPATGRSMLFRQPGESAPNARYEETQDEKTGVLVGWTGSGGSASQQSYIVVRFALLGRA